jgi:salicylate hydroxylase
MGSLSSHQLDIGVIGAGIAGLSCAVALSHTSSTYKLTCYEKSRFRNETGAAIIIGPNGTRVLRKWGFEFEKAGALDYRQMRRLRGDTLEVDSEELFDSIKEQYGDRWLLFHRADLHAGLKDLIDKIEPKLDINLGQEVIDLDAEQGEITLRNGQKIKHDLVVVADGAHSELVSKIVGRPCPVNKSPMSMYRFLQPMEKILAHSQANQFYDGRPPGFTTFYKTEVGRPGHLINTYPCRGGKLLYAALVHPTKPSEKGLVGWDSPANEQDFLADSQGFHPAIQAICEGATDIKVYTQMWRDPIQNFSRGRAVCFGDAAHLMLPTHGQGASMALEDAMALQTLFNTPTHPSQVSQKLQLFDKLRIPRVSAVQTMSNKMMGPPEKMIAEVKRYYQGEIPGPKAKTYSKEYNDFFFLYDVEKEASKLMETQNGH